MKMNNEELVLKNTIYASGFLFYINKSHDSYLYKYLKNYNINGNEYSFLLYLYHNNGSTQSDIVESFKIPKSQVSRSFKKMEEKKLIIRKVNETNKKFYKIYLTPKSIEIIKVLSQAEERWSKMFFSEIDPDEKKARKMLTKVTIKALDFTEKNR